jgi:PAS domain S-box-containing protein
MAYSLAMATPEDSKFPTLIRDLDARMEEQLTMSMNQLVVRPEPKSSSKNLAAVDDEPLPRTLYDALSPSSKAIVVTETSKPFRVIDVNKAWEGLCEYSHVESKGKSLGDLLKGTETDPLAVTSLVSQLLKGEDATAVVTNYTKSGRKFRNRLHVGPLYDDRGSVTHFVGVLQEVQM